MAAAPESEKLILKGLKHAAGEAGSYQLALKSVAPLHSDLMLVLLLCLNYEVHFENSDHPKTQKGGLSRLCTLMMMMSSVTSRWPISVQCPWFHSQIRPLLTVSGLKTSAWEALSSKTSPTKESS